MVVLLSEACSLNFNLAIRVMQRYKFTLLFLSHLTLSKQISLSFPQTLILNQSKHIGLININGLYKGSETCPSNTNI